MKPSTNVSITFNATGGGTIKFFPLGCEIENLRQFFTPNGGYDLIEELLHDKDIGPNEAQALKAEIDKRPVPAVIPDPSIHGLTAVLGGFIIPPTPAELRKFGK